MSGLALIWAANAKGLKPAAKIVLIQLADFHNKETGQCNPSAQRLADECEMDRATVFRHLTTLEERGLLTRTARGDGSGGRGSNQYELHLDVTLGPSSKSQNSTPPPRGEKSQNATGGKVANCDGGSRNAATGVVANCDTNLIKEPGIEPVCAADAAEHTHSNFDDFWDAHPRPRNRSRCSELFLAAVADGVCPKWMVRSAGAYRAENEGNKRQYIAYSDNWLAEERWQDFPNSPLPRKGGATEDIERTACYLAKRINEGKHVTPSGVSAAMARYMVETGKVTFDLLKSKGISV